MIANQSFPYISPQTYLEGERISPIKHEYRQGEIWAMTGGTQTHGTIVLNVASLLKAHLRGSGCRPFSENVKVKIDAVKAFYYPDVVVTCDDRDRHPDRDFVIYPVLVIEVLSPSTEAFDCSGKFADYRKLDSLEEYVVVSQSEPRVTCYRRDRQWQGDTYKTGDIVAFKSVGFQVAIEAFYEDVF